MNRTQKKKNQLQNTIQMGGGSAYKIVDIRTYDIRGGDLGLFINLCQKAKNNVNIGYNVFVLLKEPRGNPKSEEWTFDTYTMSNIDELDTKLKRAKETHYKDYTHAAAMWAQDHDEYNAEETKAEAQ